MGSFVRHSRFIALFIASSLALTVGCSTIQHVPVARQIATTDPTKPPPTDRAVLLVDDAQASRARIAQVENAKTEINMIYYLFREDEAGLLTLAALRRKAREGVKVRLLVDQTDHRLTVPMMQELIESGVELKIYRPYLENPAHAGHRVRKSTDWTDQFVRWVEKQAKAHLYRENTYATRPIDWLYKRMHLKMIIVDAFSLTTGGRNMENAYFSDRRYRGLRFHDTDVYAEGKVARDSNDLFWKLWKSKDVEAPSKHLLNQLTPEIREASRRRHELDHFETVLKKWLGNSKIRAEIMGSIANPIGVENAALLVDSITKKGQVDGSEKLILELIDGAEKEILIQNPYVLLTPKFKAAFKRARERKVRVVLVTNSPGSGDMGPVNAVFREEREMIRKLGIELWQFPGPAIIHGKVFVADRKRIAITSYNLDPRSENLNLESGIVFDSPKIAEDFATHLETIKAKSRVYIGPEYADLSTWFAAKLEWCKWTLIRHQL